MSRARNLADLLDSNGDVVLGALDNAVPSQTGNSGKYLTTDGSDTSWVTLSSEALTKSISLASGKSVTAGRAVSVNSSGAVGSYPVLNTAGTEYVNTSAGGNRYQAVSTDGSRALRFYMSGSAYQANITFVYAGAAINTGSNITEGTTLSRSDNAGDYNDVYQYNASIRPLSATRFAVYQAHTWRDNSGVRKGRLRLMILDVDASGNVTEIANTTPWDATTSTTGGGNPYMLDNHFYNTDNTKNTIAIICYYNTNWGYGSSQYKSVVWTTSTITVSSEGNEVQGALATAGAQDDYPNGILTSSNILCTYGRLDYATASYTAGNIGTVSTASYISDYSADAYIATIGNDTVVACYHSTAAKTYVRTYSVNQSTGDPTLAGTYTLYTGATGYPVNKWIASVDNTKFVLFYTLDGFTWALSFSLDMDKSILGTGLPVSLGATGEGLKCVYTGASDQFVTTRDVGATTNHSLFTVNAYATDPFKFVGTAKSTSSSSPVDVYVGGVADGFSSLTSGEVYYVSSSYDGTVTTDATETGIMVGRAISATEILLGVDQ